MNIQSEIDFFSDLCPVDKARFVTRLILEVYEEAKGGTGSTPDTTCLRFAGEMSQRLARFAYQLLSEDGARPPDDVIIRMLLAPRTDKRSERIIHGAYRRVLTGFETYDTTVLLSGH
jgi:hypothetical protein